MNVARGREENAVRIARFYVGTEQYSDAADRERAAVERIARAAGGVTVTRGQGAWIDGNGRLVAEPCAIFLVGAADGGVTESALECLFSVFDREDAIAVERNGDLEIVGRPALVAA